MSESDEYGVPQVPERQLSKFANSLYAYLYFHLNMHSYRLNTSQHFKEVIGRAIFCIRKDTFNFNINILDNCGYGVDRLTLCQKICSSYPNDYYFKKLYFISTFILDMIFWWHTNSDAADLSMGPDLWMIIFRNNFESEFEIHGGWQGLAEAGNECCELLPNDILPSETLLPAYFQAVISVIKELIPTPVDAEIHEAIEKDLANLNFEQMKIGAVVEAAQDAESAEEFEENRTEEIEANRPEEIARVEEIEENRPKEVPQVEEIEENRSEEMAQVESKEIEENRPEEMAQVESKEIEENRPEEMAQVEESKEKIENRPKSVDDRSSPHSALGGYVIQIENPCDDPSKKSGENVLYSASSRNPRKRRYDTPLKSDSDTDSDSESPSKARRKQQ